MIASIKNTIEPLKNILRYKNRNTLFNFAAENKIQVFWGTHWFIGATNITHSFCCSCLLQYSFIQFSSEHSVGVLFDTAGGFNTTYLTDVSQNTSIYHTHCASITITHTWTSPSQAPVLTVSVIWQTAHTCWYKGLHCFCVFAQDWQRKEVTVHDEVNGVVSNRLCTVV